MFSAESLEASKMAILGIFNRKNDPSNIPSGQIAKDRLQILLEHDRKNSNPKDEKLLETIHNEIMDVIGRHIKIDSDTVKVAIGNGEKSSKLEINVELPH